MRNSLPDLDGAVLGINLAGERIFEVSEALRRQGVPFIFAGTTVPAEYADVPLCEKLVEIRAVVQLLGDQIHLISNSELNAGRHGED